MQIIRKSSGAVYRQIKKILTPQLRHSQFAYRDKLEAVLSSDSYWLDAGCGHGLFPEWMDRGAILTQRCAVVVGIDCDCPSLWENRIVHHRVVGDLSALPFRSGSFDLISANQVVEHITDPDLLGRGLNRILKPGGLFIFHTPNYRHYQTLLVSWLPQGLKNWLAKHLEAREDKDVFPTCYRMNTADAIHRMADRTGFEVQEIELVNSVPETFALGPLAVLAEMLIIWVLEFRLFSRWRSNLVVVLKKTEPALAPR